MLAFAIRRSHDLQCANSHVELTNMKRFGKAHRRSLALLKAGQLTPDELAALSSTEREASEQLHAQLAAYRTRFEKQFSGAPDPQAPLLPKSSLDYNPNSSKPQRCRYYSLTSFLRAMISMELKNYFVVYIGQA